MAGRVTGLAIFIFKEDFLSPKGNASSAEFLSDNVSCGFFIVREYHKRQPAGRGQYCKNSENFELNSIMAVELMITCTRTKCGLTCFTLKYDY